MCIVPYAILSVLYYINPFYLPQVKLDAPGPDDGYVWMHGRTGFAKQAINFRPKRKTYKIIKQTWRDLVIPLPQYLAVTK